MFKNAEAERKKHFFCFAYANVLSSAIDHASI